MSNFDVGHQSGLEIDISSTTWVVLGIFLAIFGYLPPEPYLSVGGAEMEIYTFTDN